MEEQLNTTKETAAITEMKQERPMENENLIDDEESDIVLVEKAYLYITKGTYPENATKKWEEEHKTESRTTDG